MSSAIIVADWIVKVTVAVMIGVLPTLSMILFWCVRLLKGVNQTGKLLFAKALPKTQ